MNQRQPSKEPTEHKTDHGGEIINRATDMIFRIDLPPAIPPGEYTVVTKRGRKVTRFGRSLFELPCEIYDGPHQGTQLTHYLNLPERSRAKTQLAPRSKFAKELVVALGRSPQPGEDISQRSLEHKMFRASVKVTTRDSKNRPVLPHLRTPVVDDLLERLG